MKMKTYRISKYLPWMTLCLFTLISTAALAVESNMLTRDEVGALKKKLVAVLTQIESGR